MDKRYSKYNNWVAWGIFLIAAITYLSTAEPTVSFWDCGEFIAAGYKLEVGHPPGAPVFMLLTRLFSMFAFGNVELVASMVNSLSALASAFTILFLFWTITHMAKKIVVKDSSNVSLSELIRVMGAGAVGALAYTFSDSFWFSAVEGEVYALSSLFTAVVFWLILKWEAVADEEHSVRWLVLIALLMGLSIGVHLLNLLCIPAMVFVYYFKKYEVTRKGIIYAAVVATVVLGVIMYGIIPYTVIVASWFELLFVNGFGTPYNTGVIFYGLLLFGGLGYGIYYTHKHAKVVLNVILLSVTAMMIGYSAYAVIVIRAKADTPMDENNPDNVFALLSYLNREQYGDRPLLKGQYFNSPVKKSIEDKPVYSPIKGRYEITNTSTKYEYEPQFTTVFPRMYSSQGKHVTEYKNWSGYDGKNGQNITYKDGEEDKTINRPTFGQNLSYFFNYQIGWMYLRYFMWNFAGRQNEKQGHGDNLNGNWISGIDFIDSARLGDQSNLPSEYKNDKSRNTYYMLPLLLGILGISFLAKHNKHDSVVVALLFIFTGLAIVVYLNQPPMQPRERDYAYVGSFYAFAIWIGIGLLAVYEYLSKLVKNPQICATVATVLCLLLVPTIMAVENYDDHDRSNLYTARDFSQNYLMSCEKNAILFTNGDNDTFPLWYMQEVEGVRTDVRVCNLSLLQTDWYIDQMKRQAYTSDALPISMTKEMYIQGTRDIVPIFEQLKQRVNLRNIIRFVQADDPNYKVPLQSGSKVNFFPARNYFLPVNKAQVFENNKNRYQYPHLTDTLDIKNPSKYLDRLDFTMQGRYITKNHLAVYDLIQENNWKRPIYFANLMSKDNYLGFEKYFQADGLAYRLVPYTTQHASNMRAGIEADILYDKVMNLFKWGGLDQGKDLFLNENNNRMVRNHQNLMVNLAEALAAKYNQTKQQHYLEKAEEVLDKIVSVAPHSIVPYGHMNLLIAEAYYKIGANEKGDRELQILAANETEKLEYFAQLEEEFVTKAKYEIDMGVTLLYKAVRIAQSNKRADFVKQYSKKVQELYQSF